MGSSYAIVQPLTMVSRGRRQLVVQGGTYMDLHRMLGVTSGSQVLYVGMYLITDGVFSRECEDHC